MGQPHPKTPSNPCTVPLGPTFSSPGATLPSHGAVLLVLIGTHAQEGPFHIFTESLPTYTTEQFTFVHIHTPLPILWGLKALITEAAERAGCVVTEAVTVTHSVVNTLINIFTSTTICRDGEPLFTDTVE